MFFFYVFAKKRGKYFKRAGKHFLDSFFKTVVPFFKRAGKLFFPFFKTVVPFYVTVTIPYIVEHHFQL